MVEAQVEKLPQPAQGLNVQGGNLGDAEQVQRFVGGCDFLGRFKYFQHLHGILRQRFVVAAAGAVEKGTFAVAQANDVLEEGPLAFFQVGEVLSQPGQDQLVFDPRLDEGFLAVVFIIADEAAQLVRQMPGPPISPPPEGIAAALEVTLEGSQVVLSGPQQDGQHQQPIPVGVQKLRRRGMLARIDRPQHVPQGLLQISEPQVDGDALPPRQPQPHPFAEVAIGDHDGGRQKRVAAATLAVEPIGQLGRQRHRIRGQIEHAHEAIVRPGRD